MLTETQFKGYYEEAVRLRDAGTTGTAREILLFLFDAGRMVGGFGSTRLSFVLRDLAEIAQVGEPQRDEEAEKTLHALVTRRDDRERLARNGEAGFTELQELVALNRSLGEPRRSLELYRDLSTAAPGHEQIEAARHILGDLLVDVVLPDDIETILLWIDFAALKKRILKLQARVVEQQRALAAPEAGADAPDRAVAVFREEADRIKALVDRHRGQQAEAISQSLKQRFQALVQDVSALLDRYALVPVPWARAGDIPMDPGRLSVWLQKLASELARLSSTHGIEPGFREDEALSVQVQERAREVALLISDTRIHEDFGPPLDGPTSRYMEARIRSEGLLIYEVLLRLNEEKLAETLASWLLAFRLTPQMYADLLEVARRAGNPRMQDKLRDEAKRLTT